MKRYVICVDAGYLFAQGSVAITGTKQRREILVLEPAKVIQELRAIASSKIERLSTRGTELLRVYWYDGALGLRPTLEQEQLAHLDDVKLRLGFINSAGQQKGVDSLIVTDLIELARLGAICDAILLSGDEDVRVGVQIAQNYGVRVHLLGIAPSRGSQSKALLREADTTSEWDATTVNKFLSVRSIPAAGPVSAAAIVTPAPAGVMPPPSPAPTVAPAEAAKLQAVAQGFAEQLTDGDIRSLVAYWSLKRGIPPEFDGRLLAKCRAAVGRDLDHPQKRYSRMHFTDAVKAKATSIAS
jgi:uncharacterized LabA/DUF88 family protein